MSEAPGAPAKQSGRTLCFIRNFNIYRVYPNRINACTCVPVYLDGYTYTRIPVSLVYIRVQGFFTPNSSFYNTYSHLCELSYFVSHKDILPTIFEVSIGINISLLKTKILSRFFLYFIAQRTCYSFTRKRVGSYFQ